MTEVLTLKELSGKNALLTGGSRGLGPYIGRALAAEGVNVALTARSEAELRAVAGELAGSGAVALDLPDGATVADLRRALIKERPALEPAAGQLPSVLARGHENHCSETYGAAGSPKAPSNP